MSQFSFLTLVGAILSIAAIAALLRMSQRSPHCPACEATEVDEISRGYECRKCGQRWRVEEPPRFGMYHADL
jgi:transposase-like protein